MATTGDFRAAAVPGAAPPGQPCGTVVPVTPEESARVSGDLLVQAVEGMLRPMFVLDERWRFRYVNPAGAQVLERTVHELIGQDIWVEFPEAVGGPFERLYREVRRSGGSGATEAWFGPLRKWFRADAFLTAAGLVVTYDDVTEQRRIAEERAAAVDAREEAAAEAASAAHEAEQAGRHLMLLGDINLAMASAPDADGAVQRFAERVVPLLGDLCLVSVVDPDGARRDVGRAHRDAGMLEALHRYADARVATNLAKAPVPTALRSGEPVVIPEVTPAHVQAMVSDAPSRAALAELHISAVATFPLTARGETFGAFTLANAVGRGAHTAEELRTAAIAARRAALALDNARLAAAQQQVAERLQLSLLSPPVQPDSLQLAVRYRPATKGIAIGGDWYDAFLQPDGDTVLVIGDVMGHDIDAAAAMGQVKTLVRGIGYDRVDAPAELLRRVDHAVVGLDVPAMATALVARVELGVDADGRPARRLRWATAGHPDPLLLLEDGTVLDLTAPVGPPVGIGWLGPRTDETCPLPDGSTLLLFTDGLFERRTMLLDEGRDLLRDLVGRSAGLPLDVLCNRLLAEMLGPDVEDDVAVLAVRVHPLGADRPSEAGPQVLPPALPVPGSVLP